MSWQARASVVRPPSPLKRFFSSGWLCQESYCRGAGARRPLIVNSETMRAQATFYGKLPIHHIARFIYLFSFLFPNFSFSNFYDFFSFSLNMPPMGAKRSKATSPTVSVRFQPNFKINMLVMGECKLLLSWKLSKLKHVELLTHVGYHSCLFFN